MENKTLLKKEISDLINGTEKKGGILVVLEVADNPGHYHYKDPTDGYNDKIIDRKELENIEKYYEKVIVMGLHPDLQKKHAEQQKMNTHK